LLSEQIKSRNMSLLENLQWRYATKKYDPTKKVSQEDVDKIVEAARMAPTSSGLQQFRVIVITNQELKNKIVPIAMDQQIVADCSHLLVFAAWDRYTEERINKIYDYTTDERGLPRGRFKSYTDKLRALYLSQTAEENFVHTARQAYIGLGLSIAEAAELLDLKSKGLKSVLLLPLGYRDTENDWLVSMKKVRNPKDKFVINY
jgi:nitroreductase / dihydropteridine reductase